MREYVSDCGASADDALSSSKSSSVLPSSSVDTTSGDEHDVIRPRDTVLQSDTVVVQLHILEIK